MNFRNYQTIKNNELNIELLYHLIQIYQIILILVE